MSLEEEIMNGKKIIQTEDSESNPQNQGITEDSDGRLSPEQEVEIQQAFEEAADKVCEFFGW